MDSQPLCHLFFMLIWIFIFFLHCVRSQQDPPPLSLDSRVFVALKGNNLNIDCKLKIPANQSADTLVCVDPKLREIYKLSIPATAGEAENLSLQLVLKNLTISGEYHCRYQKVQVYWFIHVRDEGFKVPAIQASTEFILVAVSTVVLLIFSLVGSVYVFRGNWITKCRQTDKKEKQSKGERKKEIKKKDDNINAVTDPSTSFYASLQPRTRSIYDELHFSPANKKPDQQKDKPKKEEPHQTKQSNTQQQDEGQFDSVYENY